MTNFREWMRLSEQSEAERLEAAVREYMSAMPEARKCYYITRPKNPNFDPKDPGHLRDELGKEYDKSLDVVPFKHHPMSFTCANVAEGLAKFLRERGFKARKVAGWYGNAESGYHAGYSPGLDDPSPPRGVAKNPQQHWWVEAEGYYIDLTSAQFHPTSPEDQKDLVVRSKHNAFVDGSYIPVRRFPLGRAVRLPPNAQKMVEKILSLKKFSAGHSANPSDNQNLADWIESNAVKYTMSLARVHDIVSALKAHSRPGFHFADRRAMERLFGEAFDDVEEDKSLDSGPNEFKPEQKKTSRGVVRFTRSGITLNSTYPDDLEENLEVLKDIVRTSFPEAEFGDSKRSSEKGAYGNTVHFVSMPMKDPDRILSSPEVLDRLRKEKFKVG